MIVFAGLNFMRSADFGNASSATQGSHVADIGVANAENADFVVIRTHLSCGFRSQTDDNVTLHAGAASGGGRSSATRRRMSANGFLGFATSAI